MLNFICFIVIFILKDRDIGKSFLAHTNILYNPDYFSLDKRISFCFFFNKRYQKTNSKYYKCYSQYQ